MRRVQSNLDRGRQGSRDTGVEKDGATLLAGVEEVLSLRGKAQGMP